MASEQIEFTLKLKDLMSKGLSDIDSKLNKIDGSIKDVNKTSKKTSGGLSSLKIALGGLAAGLALKAVDGIWEMGKGIVNLGIEAEQTQAAFETMIGSVEGANKHIKDLKKFAAATPFELGDLTGASKTLQSFGVASEKVLPIVSMLGDVSGGNTERFKSMSLAFAQVQAAGKLTGQDLLQMINAGFNPLQTISEKTGKSIGQLKDEMSKGAISADMVTQAFIDATSEGGRFYGLMEKQSMTVGGRISTLVDKLKEIGLGISQFILPLVAKLVDSFAYFIDWVKTNFNALKEVFYPLWDAIQPIVNLIRQIAIDLGFASAEGNILASIFNTIGTIIKYISPLVKVVSKIVSTLISDIITGFKFLFNKILLPIGEFINNLLPDKFKIKMSDFGFKEPKQESIADIQKDIATQKGMLLGGNAATTSQTTSTTKGSKTLSNEVAKVQSRQPSNVYINIDAIIKGDVNNMINNANNPKQDLNNFLVQLENALLSVVNDVNLVTK